MKDELVKKVVNKLKKNDAIVIELFGSYARNEEKPTSDVDLIVQFSKRKSLLDIVKIEDELNTELGIKIDLLTPKSISPLIMKAIEKEKKVLLDER